MPVLYLVVCGAPPAAEIPEQIPAFQTDGWDVCVVATPAALDFINVMTIENMTGHPVRCAPRKPGETHPFPQAHAAALAPATFNTINKWATGISDTLALGLLNELLGAGLPITTVVWAKDVLRAHPAFPGHVQTLKDSGVRFISEGSGASRFPWHELRVALRGEAAQPR